MMRIDSTTEGARLVWPEVHELARFDLAMHRTLRIPDDGNVHKLPPSLGHFPKRHTDRFSSIPPSMRDGYIVPLYQAEALWLGFRGVYPFAVKVGAGEINAVTGKPLTDGLSKSPQDYVTVPKQPWLDGFAVEEDKIRQFVAMPLDSGFTVEEQLTGKAEFGGLQIIAYPMRPERFEEIRGRSIKEIFITASAAAPPLTRGLAPTGAMGLGQGGSMSQEIYEDLYDPDYYLLDQGQSLVVNMVNALDWFDLTGELPPNRPPSAATYRKHGLPWFSYYDDVAALKGSETLRELKTVQEMIVALGGEKLDEDIDPEELPVVELKKTSSQQVNDESG